MSRPPSSGYDGRYSSRGRDGGEYGHRGSHRPQHHNLCWTPDKGTFGGPNSNLPPASSSPTSGPAIKDTTTLKASVPVQGQVAGPRPGNSILRRPNEKSRTDTRPQIRVNEDEPQPGETRSLLPLLSSSAKVREALREFKRSQERRRRDDRRIFGRSDLRPAQNHCAVDIGLPERLKRKPNQPVKKPSFKWYAVIEESERDEEDQNAPSKPASIQMQQPEKRNHAAEGKAQSKSASPTAMKKIKVQLPARKMRAKFRIIDRSLVTPGTKVACRRTRKLLFRTPPTSLFRESRALYMRSKSEKESVVGAGTFGTVFKAKHRYTRNLVALKLIRQDDWKYDGVSIQEYFEFSRQSN